VVRQALIFDALGAVQVSKARPVKTFAEAGCGGPATVAGTAGEPVDAVEPPDAAWPGRVVLAPGVAPLLVGVAFAVELALGLAVPLAEEDGRAEPPEAPGTGAVVALFAAAAAAPPCEPPPEDAEAASAAPPAITVTAAATPA
jgi:hypothetical protein